jgi:hypothetical protein
MAKRKLMEEGPRALPTDGSIMRTVPEGTGLRGDYAGPAGRAGVASGALLATALTTLGIAAGLLVLGSRRAG